MKRDFKVLSSDGVHTLSGVVYTPIGEVRGFFHVVHGMTEHIARYDRFMREMSEQGYICFGYDHLGHGNTVLNEGELGYIAAKNGHELLCKDVKVFADAVMTEYGRDKKLPYYLMGHSMGSFITRLAAEKYIKPDKYICMGTGGKNPAAGMGLALLKVIKKIKGDRHVSKLIYKLAFGSYNKRFGGGTEDDPSPWLTADGEQRKKYYADRFCTFKFTVSAMGDLITLMKSSNRAEWYKNISKDMPILLVSGKDDPVGNYGKGVEQVCSDLTSHGCDASFILYHGARHEILNDFTYEQVKADILEFLDK